MNKKLSKKAAQVLQPCAPRERNNIPSTYDSAACLALLNSDRTQLFAG